MLEKIIPVIIALIAIQFLIRYTNSKRKKNTELTSERRDYKKRIDEFMRISNSDEGINTGRIAGDEVKSSLGRPDIIMNIPDNMRDVRKNLNLIIDGVTHGLKSKTGSPDESEIKYRDPSVMFDEIVEIIKKHRIGKD